MKPDFYYLESDGQIFLVKHKGLWRFPKTLRDLPCAITPVSLMPIGQANVLFALPVLEHHPDHWMHKDEIIGRGDVDGVVQRAVNRSLPRAAAKVAIIEKGKVLMVKARRGITKGFWNLPGGFVGYGEHPSVAARREVWEEVGVPIRLVRLLGVYSDVFKRTGGYMISFVYLGKRLNPKLRPHPEEIEEVRWMPLRQALRFTKNPFARRGIREYLTHSSSV